MTDQFRAFLDGLSTRGGSCLSCLSEMYSESALTVLRYLNQIGISSRQGTCGGRPSAPTRATAHSQLVWPGSCQNTRAASLAPTAPGSRITERVPDIAPARRQSRAEGSRLCWRPHTDALVSDPRPILHSGGWSTLRTLALTFLPPAVEYDRLAVSHSPASSEKRAPTWRGTGNTW